MVSLLDWARYENVLRKFYLKVGKQPVTWHKSIKRLSRYAEGDNSQFQNITIEVLVGYNAFRIWPTDKIEAPGTQDKEYCYLYLHKDYLEENGWLTSQGNFDFNPGYDRFTIDGVKYKPAGDTPIAQAFNHPIFVMVILARDTYLTSKPLRP